MDHVLEAVDHVLTWDLPDEAIAAALSAETSRLAELDGD